MPILDEDTFANEGIQQVAPQEKERDIKDWSHFDQMQAAFRTENVIGSSLASGRVPTRMWDNDVGRRARKINPLDPDFDPISLVPEDLTPFAEHFAYADSQEDIDIMSAKIRKELQDKQVLADSGFSGFMWTMGYAITSPETFIPIAGQAGKAVSLGNKVKGFAKAGFAGSTLSEAMLQGTQEARTLEESMYAVGAGTILSAGLGGAVHGFQKVVGTKAYREYSDAIAADLRRAKEDTKAVDSVDGLTIADLPPEGPMGRLSAPDDVDKSIGAAQARAETQTRLDAEELEAEGVLQTKKLKATEAVGTAAEKATLGTAKALMNPVKRMLESPLVEVRKFVQKLQDPSLVLAKNAQGEASDVSAAAAQRLRQTQVAGAAKVADDEYVTYVMGRSDRMMGVARSTLAAKMSSKSGDWKLTYGEFREAVGKAMRNNDSADTLIAKGEVPETARAAIEASAKAYRDKVYTPILKEFQEHGWLPEDIDVKTAESYLNRVYDRVALLQDNAKRARFLSETTNWLKEKQGESVARIAKFDAEYATLRSDIQLIKQKIQALSESANEAASKAVYEKVLNDLDELAEDSPVMDALMDAVDEAEVRARGKKVKTKEEMEQAATKKARKAFLKQFATSLTDDVKDIARQAGEEAVEDAVLDVSARVGDLVDDAKLDFVLKETPKPIVSKVVDTTGDEFASGIKRVEAEAYQAAALAYERSMKAQIKAKVKAGTYDSRSPEALDKALMAEIRKVAKQESRKAGNKAATRVTKELKEELAKKTKQLKERVGLHRRDEFDAEMDDVDFRNTADTILGRITSTGGEMGYDVSIPTRRSRKGRETKNANLKERKFLIPDDRIDFVLVNDVEKAAGNYAMSAGRDLELMKRFNGKIDPDEIIADLDIDGKFRDMEEKLVGDDKALQKLLEQKKQTKKDMKEAINVFRGRHGMPEDPASWSASLIRNVKRYNYVTKLGGMTVSAVADVGKLPAVHGYERIFGYALKPLIKNVKGMKLARKELKTLGLITEMHDNTRSRFLEGLGDDSWHYNVVDRAMGGMADTFGLPSLMAPWNQFWKSADALVTMRRLIDIVDKEAAGKTLSSEDAIFARQNFISPEYSKIIAEQIKKHGGDPVDGVQLPNVDAWDDIRVGQYDTPISDVFRMAIQRQADNTIVSNSLEAPAITKTETGGLLLQFRSFSMLTTPKTTQRLAQETSETKVLSAVSTMISLGMVSYALKTLVAGKDLSDDPRVWIAEGIDRSGLLGLTGDALNTLDKIGNVGPRGLLGMQHASRYQSRNAVGAMLGPTFGTVSALLGVATGASGELGEWLGGDGDSGWTDSDSRTMKRLIPYNNLFYINAVYNNATLD